MSFRFLDRSKTENIIDFLEKIRDDNKRYKAIVVVLDNFSSYRSQKLRRKTEELGIYLLYLPPYSPDLNPIELLWRSIKRVVSLKIIENITKT